MGTHSHSVLIALFIGILGFVVFFAFGAVSDRGLIGVVAASVFLLYGGIYLVRKFAASKWYGGAVANIPIWMVFKFVADPGQFETYFPGLVGCLLSSYAGTFLGLWLLKRKVVFGKTTIVLLVLGPIIPLIVATYILNAPKPIPSDRNMFVGVWNSGSGFTLQIRPDGTAEIVQDVDDRGVAYENLNIKVAPSHIEGANVEFWGDSILFVVRHAYYARAYRIDAHPYSDSTLYKMVLNGVTLTKE